MLGHNKANRAASASVTFDPLQVYETILHLFFQDTSIPKSTTGVERGGALVTVKVTQHMIHISLHQPTHSLTALHGNICIRLFPRIYSHFPPVCHQPVHRHTDQWKPLQPLHQVDLWACVRASSEETRLLSLHCNTLSLIDWHSSRKIYLQTVSSAFQLLSSSCREKGTFTALTIVFQRTSSPAFSVLWTICPHKHLNRKPHRNHFI